MARETVVAIGVPVCPYASTVPSAGAPTAAEAEAGGPERGAPPRAGGRRADDWPPPPPAGCNRADNWGIRNRPRGLTSETAHDGPALPMLLVLLFEILLLQQLFLYFHTFQRFVKHNKLFHLPKQLYLPERLLLLKQHTILWLFLSLLNSSLLQKYKKFVPQLLALLL